MINIVAGLGLLSFITMFCDFILLNYVSERSIVSWVFSATLHNFSLIFVILIIIGPESDHWQCLSVTHSLTNWLTDSCLVILIDMTLASRRVRMPTQNLLMLLLFLILMMWIVLAAVCCSFGSWGLVIKLNFFQTMSTRSCIERCKGLVNIMKLKFRQYF